MANIETYTFTNENDFPDYYNKLYHDYVGMAMQSLINKEVNPEFFIEDIAKKAHKIAYETIKPLLPDNIKIERKIKK